MNTQQKQLDVICIGRVAVDLYGQQIGSRLEDETSFAKYLGGSSGNVAYGTAIQGLRSGMLARVGDEHMGRFIRETLQRVGVNTKYLITDPNRLTALVILGIKDQDTFPLVFYRDNCADMALCRADIEESYIASARALAITGTHLSHPNTREAVITALEYAKKHQLRTALDIDYRPVLWGLSSLGDGETRFIESERVTSQLQEVLHYFDLIVGTEEEFHIAGGSQDTLTALKKVRTFSQATLVCKRGPLGCCVFEGEIPDSWEAVEPHVGVRVAVLNVLGAGDAFMSGLLRGWLNNEGWERACQYANACGALVVSRHGCAPAMPTKIELDYYLKHAQTIPRPDLDSELNHLHRVTTRKKQWDNLCIFAFDHRKQLEDMAKAAQVDFSRIPYLKTLLLTAAKEAAQASKTKQQYGILADTTYGQDALNAITGEGWWIGRPVEMPSSRPLRFEHSDIGSQLISWPSDHIVKCLVFYHPQDEATLRHEQDEYLQTLWQACQRTGHELLLEVIQPVHGATQGEQCYIEMVEHFYQLGIKPDWWKLPPLKRSSWLKLETVIQENDPWCRGILILGLDANANALKEAFSESTGIAKIKGFAVGRTIFGQASQSWFQGKISDTELIEQIKINYLSLIQDWQKYHHHH